VHTVLAGDTDYGGESSTDRPRRHVRVIEHRRRAAAVAADRVYYAAHIEVLEADHPERRFVAALCLYSHAVDTRQAGVASYDQANAERYARAPLMPAEEFAPPRRMAGRRARRTVRRTARPRRHPPTRGSGVRPPRHHPVAVPSCARRSCPRTGQGPPQVLS
jgi:hypothetical protein